MKKHIQTPLTKDIVKELKVGQEVLISGTIYTARDAAHSRMLEDLDKGKALPFDIEDAIIYYVGPSPAKPGEVIGSAGPTTSYRMDSFSPRLIELGQTGMIGKGNRSKEVIQAMTQNQAVYFAAVGGAAALIADSIVESEIIAYEDLGPEAVRKLTIQSFPCIVVIDCYGNSLYESEKSKYRTLK